MGPFAAFTDADEMFMRCVGCGRVGTPGWAHACGPTGNWYIDVATLRARLAGSGTVVGTTVTGRKR